MSYLKRLLAFVLSFRKRDWSVRDYPVAYRRQKSEPYRIRGELMIVKPWVVQIEGWAMIAVGDTREEALLELQQMLDAYREHDGMLPRPGTYVPPQFAPFEFMSRNEDLAREFFPPIIAFDYDDCLVTNASSVWDFPVDFDAGELARKVLILFDTDVTDLAHEGNISAILDRIAAKRSGT